MAGGHVWFLFQFGDWVQGFQTSASEADQIELSPARQAGHHHLGEAVEILLAFAGAEVHAEAGGIEARDVQGGVGHGFFGRADGEMSVPALIFPILGIFAHVGYVPVAHLGGDLGGKVAGVENGGVAYAGFAGQEPPPDGFHLRTQGRNTTDPGNHNTSSHGAESLNKRMKNEG